MASNARRFYTVSTAQITNASVFKFDLEPSSTDLLLRRDSFREVIKMQNRELREGIKFLINIIDSATNKERLVLADELHELYAKLESKAAKESIEDLENYARYGFIEVEIKQKPTSGATEVSR